MSDISKINVGGVDYNVKDNIARQGDTDISDIKKDIKNIQDLDVLQNADITALKDDTKNYVKKVNGNTPDTNGNVNISLEELNGAERAHASTTTDYGVGDSNQYGHLKLSDGIQYRDIEDKDIVPTPGVAASKYDTQKMGKELSDRINSIADIGDGDIVTSVNNITPIKGTHDITLTANDIFVNQTTTEIKPNSIQDKINKISIEPNPEVTEEDASLTSIKIGDIAYKLSDSSVKANPAVTEEDIPLKSIQIGDINYRIEGGGGTPSEGQIIQVESLPEASEELLGTIYQYIGPTDSNYTNGYFYKCVNGTKKITYYDFGSYYYREGDGEGDCVYSSKSYEEQYLLDPLTPYDGEHYGQLKAGAYYAFKLKLTEPLDPTKFGPVPTLYGTVYVKSPQGEIQEYTLNMTGGRDSDAKDIEQEIEDPFYYSWIRINVQPSNGGEGGTKVIPNPSESATASLNKLSIDDTIYSIDGGVTSVKVGDDERQTGDVVITIPEPPVKSVNGQTGDVEIIIPNEVAIGENEEIISDDVELFIDESLNYGDYTSTSPSGNNKHNYSTEEQIVGTWIDGKPLYEKTIDYGALPNKTTKDVEHHIDNVEIIWISDGFAFNYSNNFSNLLSLFVYNSTVSGWYFGVDKNIIRCLTGVDRSAYTAYITLRYTKTTD